MEKITQNLFFRYNNFAIEIDKKSSKIYSYPEWENAQLHPPKNFSFNLRIIEMDLKKTKEVLKKILKLDVKKYSQLTEKDFETTAPDQSHLEIVKLILDGKTEIDIEEGYAYLKKDLRQPLIGIYELIEKLFG